MIKLEGTEVKPTIFPDKTSQVWKLPEDLLQQIYKAPTCTITWEFESEAEVVHLAQLKVLLDTYCSIINLDLPYLPYARQDKRVDNKATFALHAFAKMLNSLEFNEVRVLDAHNNLKASMIDGLEDKPPTKQILHALIATQADCVLFPDAGARTRYSAPLSLYGPEHIVQVYADKVRDQLTGHIEGMVIRGSVLNRKILLVDDLCDGGGTFKLAAEKALAEGAKEVHLYVTHGIFSRGVQTLLDSGIQRVFTHKGEVAIPFDVKAV